ncbi:HAD family hydrolase [Bacteroides sp.]|uniref:HAD family hydrolase n=1 Tax=Bacteroides sp. TaxID=29523 RepID=UPI002609372A|nr:HAD family hydrolase [Bacteroides sp.]
MKYKHIIFDIDGTMLDSAYADLTALQRVILELQNRNYPISDLHFALGIPGEVALKQLGINEVSMANQLWNSYMKELSYTMKLFDGIKELLLELKTRGFKLGIITSKNKKEFHNDFTQFGIDTYFDTVITVEDSITPKPSAEPMLAYLNKTGVKPHEVIYIGDTVYDKECAAHAGVDFGLAMWGCHSVEQIHATYYFKTPKEVLNWQKNE